MHWYLVIAFFAGAALATENAADGEDPGKPKSPWGAYYTLDKDNMKVAFDTVFPVFKANADPDDQLSKCRAPTKAMYTRYYKNIYEGDQYILSYMCVLTKTYEHLQVSMDPTKPEDVTFIKFEDSLKAFNIFGSGAYAAKAGLEGEAGKSFVKSMFKDMKDQISNFTDCQNATLNVDFKIQFKTENDIEYWKFPVACEVNKPDDQFTELEVFRDDQFKFINNGQFTLSGSNGLALNPYVLIVQNGDSELQSSANIVGVSTVIMLFASLFSCMQ